MENVCPEAKERVQDEESLLFMIALEFTRQQQSGLDEGKVL